MLWVSTISVLGFFGSTFPKTLRAIPGLKSLVSFESMVELLHLPLGNAFDRLAFRGGLVFGPITKLPSASSGGFSPVFSTLKGGEPGSSNLRTGGWANTLEHARAAIKNADQRFEHKIPRRFFYWRGP